MAATDMHITIEKLLETVFSVRSVPRLYNEGQLPLEESRNIGQGEARHRKYKRLKLGGGQAYDCSSD
jgi:hypothetical protein